MKTHNKMIVKDDGFPVTALLEGAIARIIEPHNSGSWICLQLHTHAHESAEVQDQLSEFLPPETFQLAMDPATAHRIGLYLIEKAQQAVEPGR
jgi:hypothetical protein